MSIELLHHHRNPTSIQLGFPPNSMPDIVVPMKPTTTAAATPILDRFRDMVRSSDYEVVRAYEVLLSELTFNSKPIITELTIVAGESKEYAEGIVDVVCSRILEVPDDQKLPALYLLDSIVKNIGQEYVRYFSSRLPEVFCEAYSQMQSHLYPAMRHLFRTWSTVFPSSVLRKIEARLQFSPSLDRQPAGSANVRALESSRPSHGIHVNPKYLEAKRQFDSSSVNTNMLHARPPSTSKILGKRSASGYDGYDFDQVGGTAPLVGAERMTEYGGRTSFDLGADRLLPSVAGHTRPLSPALDDFGASRSPARIAERLSPSRGLSYGLGKFPGKGVEGGDWPKRRGFENPPANGPSNGYLRDRPRALIDAYGQDDAQRTSSGRPQRADPSLVNGMNSKLVSRPWQNSEEEEFDWEDMSPTTLVDRRNNDATVSSGSRPSLGFTGSTALDPSFRSSNWPAPVPRSQLNHSTNIADEKISAAGHAPFTSGVRTQASQLVDSHRPQEMWKSMQRFPDPSSNNLPNGMVERISQISSGAGRLSPYATDKAPLNVDHLSRPDSLLGRMPTSEKIVGSTGFDSINAVNPSTILPPSSGFRHPTSLQDSHLPAYSLTNPPQKQTMGQLDFIDTNNRFINQPQQQQFNGAEVKNPMSVRPQHLPNPLAGSIPLHHLAQPPLPFQIHTLPASEAQQTSFSSSFAPAPMLPVSRGYLPGAYGPAANNTFINPGPGVRPFMPPHNIHSSSLQIHGAIPPRLPPNRASSQGLPLMSAAHIPQQSSGNPFSGLISSLVAQGLVSLPKQAPGQDSMGVDFDQDLLKVRHESAIRALYGDLPRQCRTCGLRFKTQEEHSKHMDWHVTKNRLSRNRKQNPSRKWFVSVNVWLTGAEALGTDSAPGFLPTETAVEKKDDEETVVPADEDQTACALCGEPFEDFYSDEAEEWMYRGAVYLNVPVGSMAGVDRSHLGPIVHAKCRSDSSVVPPKDMRQEEGGTSEEGGPRKRMRT